MPDFATVRIRVPYRAEVFYRAERRHLDVDQHFDVPIAAVARADATLVARVRRRDLYGKTEAIDFLGVDGGLFRPFLVEDEDGPWTADRCRIVIPFPYPARPAIAGGSKIRLTRRPPQRGHIMRSWRPASGMLRPRVQTSVSRLTRPDTGIWPLNGCCRLDRRYSGRGRANPPTGRLSESRSP
jgi:hypothetical protein